MNSWIWIPITVAAAAAQTVRNAAQRSLVESVGTLPATLVRFVYGLPFAVCALVALAVWTARPLPVAHAGFIAWVGFGAIAQLAATAFLIAAMERRSFVVAVVFSKTEIVQVALYAIVLLGEALSLGAACAIAFASAGVMLLAVKPSVAEGEKRSSWFSPAAGLGLASGAGFALSAVGYRAATLALDTPLPWVAGIYSLVWAQSLQSLLLGGYLVVRNPSGLVRVMVQWRVSTLAGLMGALASMGWLTAFALRSPVDVRIVGLVEVIFSYAMTRRFFAEPVTPREAWGIVLVVLGMVLISAVR